MNYTHHISNVPINRYCIYGTFECIYTAEVSG